MYIFINANIHTMDDDRPKAEAMVISEDRITYIGNNEDALQYRENPCEIIDLMGKTVLPGLYDTHLHLLSIGNTLGSIKDLANCKSIDEIVISMQEFINDKKIPEGLWIEGRGWNEDNFHINKTKPNKYDLDKISMYRPICIINSCCDTLSVNTATLRACNMEESDGIIKGKENINKIYSFAPDITVEKIKYSLIEGMNYALSKGLTSCATDDFEALMGKDWGKVLEAYKQLCKEKKMRLRVYHQCRLNDYKTSMMFIDEKHKTGEGNSFFKIGPFKLITDGGLTGRTALLNEPYADAPNEYGKSIFTQEELEKMLNKAYKNGMQLAVHCIGDKAMDMVINVYEKIIKENNLTNHRYSIIHAQITSDNNIKRMKELNIIAHIQPIFVNYDHKLAVPRLGEKRAKKSYAWKTMLEENIKIAFGTDSPVEDLSPMDNIYSAVTRKALDGEPKGGWHPEQCLSVEESIKSYTVNSAYSSFEENIKGKLKENMLADFIVLDHDIYNVDKDFIKDIKVEMTILNGDIVYKK